MKKLFLHFALLLLITSCSLREDSIDVNPNDLNSVENKILNEAITLRSSLFAITTKSIQDISITELKPLTKSSSITSYVVNYQSEGGYAVITANGDDITTVAITSGGYLNPAFLQEAIYHVENTTSTYYEGGAESPQDFEYGDEYMQPFPMDPLPYEEDLVNNTEPLPNDHPSIRFIAETLVSMENLTEDEMYETVNNTIDPINTALIRVWIPIGGVAPLIKTKWAQNGVYQQSCPIMSNGERALVGCVAVAVGQVVAYLAPPHISYDWDRLVNIGNKDDVYAESASAEDKELVADFLRYIADGVQTNYGALSSGSTIQKSINFYTNEILLPNIATHNGNGQLYFQERMKERLDFHLPINMFATFNEGKHAFIIDGYMLQRKHVNLTMSLLRNVFHINWGWNGRGDGYYAFPNLNTSDRTEYDSGIDTGADVSGGVTNAQEISIITYANPSWRFFPIEI